MSKRTYFAYVDSIERTENGFVDIRLDAISKESLDEIASGIGFTAATEHKILEIHIPANSHNLREDRWCQFDITDASPNGLTAKMYASPSDVKSAGIVYIDDIKMLDGRSSMSRNLAMMTSLDMQDASQDDLSSLFR